jgi:hypothetical protein
MTAGPLWALPLGSCDPILYARATAPLVVPVDSVCLKGALARRFGKPSMRPILQKRTRTSPAELWLYYDRASFTQIFADSGLATLVAAKPVSKGLEAVFSPPRARQDSVSRRLGRDLLAVRDACGGRPPPGRPELTFDR